MRRPEKCGVLSWEEMASKVRASLRPVKIDPNLEASPCRGCGANQ